MTSFLDFEIIIAWLIKSVNVEIGPKSGAMGDVDVKTRNRNEFDRLTDLKI